MSRHGWVLSETHSHDRFIARSWSLFGFQLSPIHRFDALRAPLLVVHSETDANVPLEEAEQVVTAARERGVSVEYLLFREEGHELSRVRNKEVFVERTVGWLTAWLCAAEAPAAEHPTAGAPTARASAPEASAVDASAAEVGGLPLTPARTNTAGAGALAPARGGGVPAMILRTNAARHASPEPARQVPRVASRYTMLEARAEGRSGAAPSTDISRSLS